MGAILGGTMRSPLTGILFAIELTGDLHMLLPLVVAVAAAHAFTVLTLRRSILTEKVARRGFHVSREYAIDALEILFVRDVMNTGPRVLSADAPLHDALAALSDDGSEKSQHLFPVLDGDARLVGALSQAEILALTRDPKNLERTIGELADPRPPTIFTNQTLRTAVFQMAEAGVTRLLVVNPADSRRLVGKLALHDLLKAQTRHLEEEQRRQRILPWEYILPQWMRQALGNATSGPPS
jgi:CBS domain-containing protein